MKENYSTHVIKFPAGSYANVVYENGYLNGTWYVGTYGGDAPYLKCEYSCTVDEVVKNGWELEEVKPMEPNKLKEFNF